MERIMEKFVVTLTTNGDPEMNFSDNPLSNLADAMAHAEYEGFSEIEYETRDWVKYRDTGEDVRISTKRRPTRLDFWVWAMFPQMWGSTALGHGGIGGAAMTTAYTIILECDATREFLVYFGGKFCYKVNRDSPNFSKFVEDCNNRCLKDKRNSHIYNPFCEESND